MMVTLHTTAGAVYLVQVLVSTFLAVLFLQSGIDKVLDRAGNLGWLTGHFAKSLLARMVPLMLTVLTLLELLAGALSGVGCLLILFTQESVVAFLGAVTAAFTLLGLFLGQRMAKDYAGAASLVAYFLLALVAVYVLAVQ